ncbi:hypothetical protein [Burkholderia ubonensis]|uniref:hypothetical protein n=1 Tax=Burkholderia ubonensis TaxID=101571 RepID=UPI0012FB12A6|nr:hypothetical protein [Burkholderia ubonensis]
MQVAGISISCRYRGAIVFRAFFRLGAPKLELATHAISQCIEIVHNRQRKPAHFNDLSPAAFTQNFNLDQIAA